MPTFTIRIADPGDAPTIARHRAEMFRDMGTLADDVYTTLLDATTSISDGPLPPVSTLGGWRRRPIVPTRSLQARGYRFGRSSRAPIRIVG